jgi:hypothetical protein
MLPTASELELRRRLDEMLGEGILTDHVFAFLSDTVEFRESLRRGQTVEQLNQLTDKVWDIRERLKMPLSTAARTGEAASPKELARRRVDRSDAISRLLAKQAENDGEVIGFRRRRLRGRLLAPGDVPGWIGAQRKKDGPATGWLIVAFPPRHKRHLRGDGFCHVSPPYRVSKRSPLRSLGTTLKLLKYIAPRSEWVQKVPTAAGGVLEELRSITERLAAGYGWTEAQVTGFVLTGEVPLLPLARVTEQTAEVSRIILDVDASLTPKQVASFYLQARRGLTKRRARQLKEKNLRLTTWNADRADEEGWPDKMKAWNRQFPGWGYSRLENFIRDVRESERRLLAWWR